MTPPPRSAWSGIHADEPETPADRALLARISGNPRWLTDPDGDGDDDGDAADVNVDLGDPVGVTNDVGGR